MIRRAYVHLNLAHAPSLIAVHLPGLIAPIDGFTIGSVRITKLSFVECLMIEKSQFMDDLADAFVSNQEPMLAIAADWTDDESNLMLNEKLMRIALPRMIRALRTITPLEIWNPYEFVSYRRKGALITRDTGLFGRLAFQPGPPRVELTLDEIDLWDNAFAAVDLLERYRHDIEIDRAFTLVESSYSPAHSSHAQRITPLIAALEILTGGGVDQLERSVWRGVKLADWVIGFRDLRNALAHGRHEELEKIMPKHVLIEQTRLVTGLLLLNATLARLADHAAETVVGPALVERAAEGTGAMESLSNWKAEFPRMMGS